MTIVFLRAPPLFLRPVFGDNAVATKLPYRRCRRKRKPKSIAISRRFSKRASVRPSRYCSTPTIRPVAVFKPHSGSPPGTFPNDSFENRPARVRLPGGAHIHAGTPDATNSTSVVYTCTNISVYLRTGRYVYHFQGMMRCLTETVVSVIYV